MKGHSFTTSFKDIVDDAACDVKEKSKSGISTGTLRCCCSGGVLSRLGCLECHSTRDERLAISKHNRMQS